MASKIPEPQTLRISLEGFDPGEMIDAVQGGTVDHWQLTPGHFVGDLLHASAPRANVDWGRYNLPVMFEGTFSPEHVTLGFVLHENEDARFSGTRVSPGSMLVFSEGHELVGALPSSSNWVSVQMERDAFDGSGFEPPTNSFFWSRLEGRALCRLEGSLFPALELLHRNPLHGRGGDSRQLSLALANVEDITMQTLHDRETVRAGRVVPGAYRLSKGYRLARRVAGYMRDRLSQPITIAEICMANGCTYKSLERAFLRTYGVRPKEYLTLLRLCRLREILMDGRGPRSLTDSYLGCGLSHFGRAASYYRALFGEPPSTTMARRAR